MPKTDLREKYISYLTEKGMSRKAAEEAVDITDDAGNVIGLIDEEALYSEACIRDIFHASDARRELAQHILDVFPSLPDKLRHILEEDASLPHTLPENDEK